MKRVLTCLILSLAFVSGYAQQKLEGSIQLSGAFAIYPIVVRWSEEFRSLHPEVTIDISAGGAGKGMTDVLSGVVDIGMVSRHVYDVELEKGAFPVAVVKDAVVPTINTQHPLYHQLITTGLTQEAAKKAWLSTERLFWGDILGNSSKIPLHVYTRSDACGAAETWAAFLGVKQEDLEGTAVFGDPGVSSAVQKDKIGIGFNNLAYVYDQNSKRPFKGIAVMPIDLNNNGQIDYDESFYGTITDVMAAIAADKYPSPPARDLYLVTKGKPENQLVKEFLFFILTEGQKYASETGYISLSSEAIANQIKAIE